MSPEVYEEMARLEDGHWWFVARRAILQSVLQALPLPATPHILELGCGTGGNLPMLREFGAVTAVEMNDSARRYAHARNDCSVLPGHLPHHLPSLPPVDLVCLFDVLEHIPDDFAALQSILNNVKPGGHLVLTVPAYQWLWSEHDIAHHHQRRYRAGPLRAMAERAGWQVRRVGYFNTWLLPLVAAHRIKQRLLSRSNTKSDARLPARWVNSLLQRVFASEARWLRQHTFPCGVSIVAVLVRK